MSDRKYLPPRIGDSTPTDILFSRRGRDFTNIRQRRGGDIVISRNIAIFIDGACIGNGTYQASAGMGVYFGPQSDYNFSEPLEYGPQTNQRAEIHAAICALRRVRELSDYGDLDAKTVVLVSDSKYVVDAMTDWVYKWCNNGWLNAKGWEVTNKDDFQILDNLIDDLESDCGIYVKFWHVDREYNQYADELAKDAAEDGL